MEEKVQRGLSIIESVEVDSIQRVMEKIAYFQRIVQSQLKQNHDYGIIPGTPKPTLLKPGAEKILMLLGLRSRFTIEDSTRDFEKGFFQYQVKTSLYKEDVLITEGLGAANTRESKYHKADPYTIDNTVLKVAKKRSLIDATLLVGSLSDIFTQDVEDMDLRGEKVSTATRIATDQDDGISKAQARRMFAISGGQAEIVRGVLKEYGYERSEQVKKIEYEAVCAKIEAKVKAAKPVAKADDEPF